MLRTIGGVIVGYIVIGLLVFGGLTGLYVTMGENWAYQEGTYHVSTKWAVSMLAVGLVAALIGGLVCRVVAGRSRRAVPALAVVIVVLGALSAALQLGAPKPSAEEMIRVENTPVFEAAGKARTPAWVLVANPIVGVAGVLLAGTVGRKKAGNGAGAHS